MTSPFVRRQRLATELRTLGEERGITADELAKAIFRSRTTISKLENARCRPDLGDISNILNALDAPRDRVEKIFRIARQAAQRGWWDTYGDAMGDRQRIYANIESGAATIRGYNQFVIPGLLQTPEFIKALIKLDEADGPPKYNPERMLDGRRMRQASAGARPPDRLTACASCSAS